MSDHIEEFWERMGKVMAGMLGTPTERLVPMSPNLREDHRDGRIWFITAKGTDLVELCEAGPQEGRFVVGDHGAALWADIEGQLELHTDPAIVDEVWNAMAGAWFEEGKQDPDLRLLAFTPRAAEVTLSEESGVKYFYEIAKAKITGEKPDGGWQGVLTF